MFASIKLHSKSNMQYQFADCRSLSIKDSAAAAGKLHWTTRIAIAGGGLSGLYAAFLLEQQGMIEVMPFDKANEAYQKMKSGNVKFRMVLIVANGSAP